MSDRSKMSTKFNNSGSTIIEATIVIPLFLFVMLGFYHMAMTKYAEGILYEAASETAEYIAEFAYISPPNSAYAEAKYREYVDDSSFMNKYISSISFFGTRVSGDDVVLHVSYEVSVEVIGISRLTKTKSFEIRQRLYKGEIGASGNSTNNSEEYVYITENKEVYHVKRDCSHLLLSVRISTLSDANNAGFTACEKCGSDCKNIVLVTDEGHRYHSSRDCSGLKRTVSRVKKSSIGGIPACERCYD